MAAVQPIRRQSFEAIYDLLRTSLLSRKPISATYKGKPRLLCPHVLGRNKEDVPYALCYQFGGESNTGLKDEDSADNWRCLRIEKLTDVELIDGRWDTPGRRRASRQWNTIRRIRIYRAGRQRRRAPNRSPCPRLSSHSGCSAFLRRGR